VPADRRDIELPAKIRAEAQGILAWAVRGAIEYFANGLGTAEVIEAATAEYQEQADPVQDFTIAHVRVTPPEDRARMTIANTTTATALYEAYCSYCKSVRAKTVTLTTFGTRMEQRGYEKRRTNHGYVYWVTLANLEGEPKEDIVELLDNGEPDPWD
jgi:putative DNA primase/helicase